MSKRFIITADHGHGTVYLCYGGGAFRWWTPHASMASKLRKEDANRLASQVRGTIEPAPMGGAS